MTKGKRILTVAVCLVIVAGGITGGAIFYRANQSKKHKVEVIPVSRIMEQYWGDEIYMDGVVSASNNQSVILSSDQLVEKVLVKEGDIVKKGTPLLDYDMMAVELEVAQKKTSLALAEDHVRQAEKELEKLKNLRPSEEMPDFDDDFFEPDDFEETEMPPNILSEVKDVSEAAAGNGNTDSPYQFACNESTIVRTSVLEQISSTNSKAVFVVYDETGYAAYAWIISADSLSGISFADWTLGEHITLTENGGVQISGGGIWYGIVQVGGSFDYDPAGTSPDEPTEPTDTTDEPSTEPSTDNTDNTDNTENTENTDETSIDDLVQPAALMSPLSELIPLASKNESEDYMYSRSELQYKISQQELEIHSMEIEVKKAKIEYDAALEKQKNPQELAKIDGVVSKVAKSAEELEINEPYLVVRGEGSVMVQGNASEMYLDEIKPGTIINVSSWDTGETVSARVTEIGNVPTSYDGSQNYGENPNSSLYPFRATVEEDCDLSVGNYISITFSGEISNNNFYIPLSYVRQKDGQYYVMKESRDGKLEKQIIQTGKIIYGGYAIEIISGLSDSDNICFPYGKYVTEGAAVKKKNDTSY